MDHNVAAIVEGDTEERFFKSILNRKCPVIYGIPNGMESVAPCIDYIADKVKTLPHTIEHIFVVLDRERRESNITAISSAILSKIDELHGASFYIGVPDKMIENWVCYSIAREKVDANYPGDGCHGKNHLGRMLGYSPGPTETAAYLKGTLASELAEESESFLALFRQVPDGINYWFDR